MSEPAFGRTIQIFLPAGDARGMRVAELTTRIVQVVEIPRKLLGDFLLRPEATQVGLYFLVGPAEDGESKIYIGQSGNVGARLATHDKGKDFWSRAYVVLSKTNNLTDTHVRFLERHSLDLAKSIGRVKEIDNGNSGLVTYTPEPLRFECLEIFETAASLLTTLGLPVFEPLSEPTSSRERVEYLCSGPGGAHGRGDYTAEGLVVRSGSTARIDLVPSVREHPPVVRLREALLASGKLKASDGVLKFTTDTLFETPSQAAVQILGRSANGWYEWKASDGRTLHDIERAIVESATSANQPA